MDINILLLQVSDKHVNVDEFVELVINNNRIRGELVKQLVTNPDIMVYYHCYYIISKASQERPELFYNYWNDFSLLLHHKNSYHRDIALTIIANLTKVDCENLFLEIFDDYFDHINDEKFMTALCCIRNSKKIICNKKSVENQIIDMLLVTDNNCDFSIKQKELLKYDILEIFDEIYVNSSRKSEIDNFIKNQLNSASPKTKKKAKDLIKKCTL